MKSVLFIQDISSKAMLITVHPASNTDTGLWVRFPLVHSRHLLRHRNWTAAILHSHSWKSLHSNVWQWGTELSIEKLWFLLKFEETCGWSTILRKSEGVKMPMPRSQSLGDLEFCLLSVQLLTKTLWDFWMLWRGNFVLKWGIGNFHWSYLMTCRHCCLQPGGIALW